MGILLSMHIENILSPDLAYGHSKKQNKQTKPNQPTKQKHSWGGGRLLLWVKGLGIAKVPLKGEPNRNNQVVWGVFSRL